MSISSMTGFGRGSASRGGLTVEVELSSVNRKQFDLRINTPRSLSLPEAPLQERLRRAVGRGSLTCNIRVSMSAERRCHAAVVDRGLAVEYVKRLRAAARACGLDPEMGAGVLLQLPDVVRFDDPSAHVDRIQPLVGRALEAALARFLAMRRKEGLHLERDLRTRFGGLERLAKRIGLRAPKVVKRYRDALAERIRNAGVDVPDAAALSRELALFADRCDISEEMTRLASHLRQAGAFLRSSEPAGRSLDFLCQELFREINTIGSKANDAEITRVVIALKTDLERIREQVQNVE